MAEIVTKVGKKAEFTSIDGVVKYYKAKLSTDPNWAVRGLMRIYRNQTSQEQAERCTAVDNGVGFTGSDAPFLTSLAEQFRKNGRLSEKQIKCLYKQMPKYARQLFNCGVEEGRVSKVGSKWVF